LVQQRKESGGIYLAATADAESVERARQDSNL
jgi:hypothetical protein